MRIPSGDLFLMIVSTILALLLWLWVAAEERSEIIVSIPLEYRNLPRNYEVISHGELLSKVNIWVKGSTATIKNLQPAEVTVWVDLQDTKPGDRSFELTTANVRAPYGFSVLRISPSHVSLRIEEAVRRSIPVQPKLEGQPPEGFTISSITVTPPQIEILGPTSAVNSVRRVTTDSIDVSSLTSDHQEKVKAGVENSFVRLGNIKEVTVLLRVSEIEDILALKQVPIVLTDKKRQIRFSPKFLRVDLQAPKRILSKLNDDSVEAVLDVKGLASGVYELTPRIVYSDEEKKISVIQVKPERIHVKIQ